MGDQFHFGALIMEKVATFLHLDSGERGKCGYVVIEEIFICGILKSSHTNCVECDFKLAVATPLCNFQVWASHLCPPPFFPLD